jgi:predicted amidophosphoribosyltransferase
MMRMLWPRIVYWTGVVLTMLGVFYALTGLTAMPGLAARSNTQSGGAVFALVGVLAMMGAKAWMDAVVRARNQANCPACQRRLPATLPHCSSCGAPQRTTSQILRALVEATSCTSCGARAERGAAFCRSCGRALATTHTVLAA